MLALKALTQKWQVAFMLLFPWPKQSTELNVALRRKYPNYAWENDKYWVNNTAEATISLKSFFFS